MISNKMKTVIAEKIVKSYYDKNKVNQEEYRLSLLHLLMSTILCIIVCGIHLFVKFNFGDYSFSNSMFVGIFYEIPAVFIILILTSGSKEDKYGVRHRLPLKCIICNILCLIEAVIIFTWIPYYFTYDFVTDTSTMGFGKVLICAPILFVIMIVWALINNDPVLDTNNYYNYNSDLYITITKSGINPNQIPREVYTDKYINQLSAQDWRDIGNLVLEYGYNLFTK